MQFQNVLGGVVSGSTIRIDPVDASSTVVVPFFGSADVVLTPPEGWIYRVRAIELWAGPPAGATWGTHGFRVVTPATTLASSPLVGVSTYDRMVKFSSGGWAVANRETRPIGAAAQQLALSSLLATRNDPLMVTYDNGTDADQVGQRNVFFTFERVAV